MKNSSFVSSNKFQHIILLVQLATISVFLGRAWQHIIWDAPFRTLLWDENWMNSILPWFSNISYDDFITSSEIDESIQNIIKANGWFYILCALLTIFIKKIPRLLTYILWLGAASLVILAFLYCKEKFFQWGQFWEYSLQFGSPIFLFYLWKGQKITDQLIFSMKIAIAITFISHGLYAINYYPRPGHFTEMVMTILGVKESTAIHFLNFAGILDFVMAIGIFINGKIRKWMLMYAIFWGLATTSARIIGHFYFDMMEDTLMMWVHEAIYRMPHFLIPMVVYYFYWIKDKKQNNEENNLTF